MSTLDVQLADSFTAFEPGMPIAGTVSWDAFPGKGTLEVNLVWHTEGRGDKDAGVADTKEFSIERRSGTQEFQFIAPQEPYSFSGRLISLLWEVEAILHEGEGGGRLQFLLGATDSVVAQAPLLIAPRGKEIELRSVDG